MDQPNFADFGEGAAIFEPLVVLKPEQVMVGAGTRIDSFVKIEGGEGVLIGRCVHISSFVHINIGGGRVVIGDYVGVVSGARILGGSNMKQGLAMSAAAPAEMQVVERKTTTIGRYAFVGTNATVLPGVTIGEGAILGAGGVATKDIPAWEIWGGVPAHKIGERARPAGPVWVGMGE